MDKKVGIPDIYQSEKARFLHCDGTLWVKINTKMDKKVIFLSEKTDLSSILFYSLTETHTEKKRRGSEEVTFINRKSTT